MPIFAFIVGDLLELYPADRPDESKRLILMVGVTSLEKKPQMSAQMQVIGAEFFFFPGSSWGIRLVSDATSRT